jgi:hypothetical protein
MIKRVTRLGSKSFQLTGFYQASQKLCTKDFEMTNNEAYGQCYADHQDQISDLTEVHPQS